MAINTTRAWTGSTIAPSSTPAPVAAATPSQTAANPQFVNSLLNSLFGGGQRSVAAPASAPPSGLADFQNRAIENAIMQIGAENWRRSQEAAIRLRVDPRAFLGQGLQGVSPVMAPLGGGLLPAQNPVVEQFLSNQRLAPSIQLGTAASLRGSGQQFAGQQALGGSVGPQLRGWTPAFAF